MSVSFNVDSHHRNHSDLITILKVLLRGLLFQVVLVHVVRNSGYK